MRILDLTRPLLTAPVWREGSYSDPVPLIAEWCDIPDRGFRVQRLHLGTQSGTHMDAPAHFVPGGATLEALPAAAMIGLYFHLSAAELADPAALEVRLAALKAEPILFLLAPADPVPEAVLDRLLGLGRRVWVLAGALAVAGFPATHANLRLAEAGGFLVEDIDPDAAAIVPRKGVIASLPLRLDGATGSPCRVVIFEPDSWIQPPDPGSGTVAARQAAAVPNRPRRVPARPGSGSPKRK